jgi:hypothetical protein
MRQNSDVIVNENAKALRYFYVCLVKILQFVVDFELTELQPGVFSRQRELKEQGGEIFLLLEIFSIFDWRVVMTIVQQEAE